MTRVLYPYRKDHPQAELARRNPTALLRWRSALGTGGIKKLGAGEVNRPLPWAELTEEQRRFQATKMAVHAAMVDRMDQNIGRLLAGTENRFVKKA